MSGTIKSAIGLGNLLWMGIGDTIRVSLSADPVEEVKVGYDILKSLGLRHRGVNIISCPSCARQGFNVIKTVETLEQRLEHVKTPMSLSIIGCVVNGPGEALMTDVGFTGGGSGHGMVYWAASKITKSATMIWSITSSSWSKNALPRLRLKLRRRSEQGVHFVLGSCAVEAKQRPIARDPAPVVSNHRFTFGKTVRTVTSDLFTAHGPVLDRLSMTEVRVSPYPQHVR